MRIRCPSRRGVSLVEVLLSLAIFLLALVGLTELVSFANHRALDAEQRTQALQLCQSRLAEVEAGSIPLTQQNDAPCDEDGSYSWSLDAEEGSVAGLYNVTVRVSRTRANGDRIQVSLSKMVLDPSTVGSTQDTPPPPTSSTSSSSSSGSSSSSSSGTTGSSTPATTGSATSGTAAPATSGSTTSTKTGAKP